MVIMAQRHRYVKALVGTSFIQEKALVQYVGTWFPWFQGHPLISGAMPLESGAGFA